MINTKKALIIDDDEGVRDYVRFILEGEGWEVVEAVNGIDGIQMMEKHLVVLVVTDIVMPQGEGMETIMALKKRTSPPKIIAMSGVGYKDLYLVIAKEIGACAAIGKPFSRQQMVDAVAHCFGEETVGSKVDA